MKRRIKWSETSAGREVAEFMERAKQGRPQVDESLCFTCQEKPPTHEATRGSEKFKLCEDCALLVEASNRVRNRMKTALGQGRGGDVFRMTLGVDLLPTRIDIRRLPASPEGGTK